MTHRVVSGNSGANPKLSDDFDDYEESEDDEFPDDFDD